MTDLTIAPAARLTRPRPSGEQQFAHRTQETAMTLIQEALARSHQHEAQRRAAEHRLARRATAGRGWVRLASWATDRAARARSRVS